MKTAGGKAKLKKSEQAVGAGGGFTGGVVRSIESLIVGVVVGRIDFAQRLAAFSEDEFDEVQNATEVVAGAEFGLVGQEVMRLPAAGSET